MRGLFSINVGEFGWCLMNHQAAVRHRAKNYDHIVVCDYPSNFALYTDFANELISHEYDKLGTPLCQHIRVKADQPRIGTAWFKEHGCPEFEPWKRKGYDVLWPPESKPDAREIIPDQDFIKFGEYHDELAFDVVMHARARKHMSDHNWPGYSWDQLIERLLHEHKTVAAVGLKGQAWEGPDGVQSFIGVDLQTTMNVMASSALVIGPSSGPLCLSSLCGTPFVTWFARGKWVGASLVDRFMTTWNPLKTRCWPLEIGWRPPVDTVYGYVMRALEEVWKTPKAK